MAPGNPGGFFLGSIRSEVRSVAAAGKIEMTMAKHQKRVQAVRPLPSPPPKPVAARPVAINSPAKVPLDLHEPFLIKDVVPKGIQKSFHQEIRTCLNWQWGRTSMKRTETVRAWSLIIHNQKPILPNYFLPAKMVWSCLEPHLEERGLLKPGWKFFRIHCDGRTDGQYGYIHKDMAEPHYLSCLYYVNSTWKPEWGGPTNFYAQRTPLSVPAHEADAKWSFEFSPGGWAVFPSNMPHSSTAPQNGCSELRITMSFIIET
jgi:hypothetical protein